GGQFRDDVALVLNCSRKPVVTAWLQVLTNGKNNMIITVHALIDSGADVTLISQKVWPPSWETC
ncbi:unnamed protein product, partial [Bubo scandiacus]